VLIKICGITAPGDAEAAIEAGADLLGFVFRSGTPRALDPAACGWVRGVVGAEKVGVFLDASLDEILRIRDLFALDWVQLHGEEPDAYLEAIGKRVIRRVPVAAEIDWPRVAALCERCLPLFDPGAGTGVAWAWEALAEHPPGVRFGLAGGLTPDTVADAVRVVRPRLVDVSSGVEAAPGIKDHDKIRAFVAAARGALG
jgi:phosphoribosylanthranilate isomerase